ncbi:8506_t:CDS:2, partial [Cetraspora pellucida]
SNKPVNSGDRYLILRYMKKLKDLRLYDNEFLLIHMEAELQIINLLNDSDEYNVIIHVGKGENVKTFQAHSLILRARCSYYKTALSKQWAKKEGDSSVLRQPNVTPKVFEIILKDIMEVLEILAAADELLLTDLLDFIQDHLIETKSEAILPPELEDDIVRCHLKVGSRPTFGTNAPRGNSVLIAHQQMSKIADWIDKNDISTYIDAKISRVSRYNYAITMKDESHGPCFGDKDLWMQGDFSQPDSCSSKEDDYETLITKHRKFSVSEYEVFKVIKK